MQKYNPQEIESKWQKKWEEESLYKARDFDKKPKFYTLIEFPYPSGAGLHVGHVRSWSAMDAYSRKKRMEGYNVLYPIGWDAFGLPAENYAIKNKIHPRIAVEENIANFKRQIKSLGLSFDWSREIDTTDPNYYKWTQWIFLQFFKNGLAYQADVQVNWCPVCKTNLADEEVLQGGIHERCSCPTEKRLQKQWLLKITKYADKLLEDLKLVDYSRKIAVQQVNWIGRSEGLIEKWKVEGMDLELESFTTWPHTTWGATFMVIAPEHPVIKKLVKGTEYEAGAEKFIKDVEEEKKKDPKSIDKDKKGFFLGRYVINPLSMRKMPLYIANFAVMEYGTGIVKCTPTHDQRDFEFAKKYNLPFILVVRPKGSSLKAEDLSEAYTGSGIMTENTGPFEGMADDRARGAVSEYSIKKGHARKAVNYHLRDWVFSRQHYWGEPIPVVHCKKCGVVAVSEKDLPIDLPYLESYEPSGTGESPLAKVDEWVNVACPECGGDARRETDTMPNWAGSNWYYLRYLDPQNDLELAEAKKMEYWMPIDIYQGGFEHTTLHLLYSRFVYKFLYDIGVVPNPEPYAKRRSHGIVLGPDGRKMSKSLGNIINPDEIVSKFGADTLRVYEMFMGPFDQTIAWSEEGVEGCYRFLKRVWSLANTHISKKPISPDLLVSLNKTIKKVSEDLETMKFNTAVASMMEFINAWQKDENGLDKVSLVDFLLILSPFAPHLAEELFFLIKTDKKQESIHKQAWPKYDPKLLEEKEVLIVVQVNGKVRDTLRVGSGQAENFVEQKAKESAKVKRHLEGKNIKKVVYVEGKIINFVIE